MKQKFSFTISFSGNLDMFPGWGHNEPDWIVAATKGFLNSAGYDPKVEVLACSNIRGGMGGWTDLTTGWREDVDALRHMDPMTMIQFETRAGRFYDWCELWAIDLDNALREPGKRDAILAFRLENKARQPKDLEILARMLPHMQTVREFQAMEEPITEEHIKAFRHAVEELADDSGLLKDFFSDFYEEVMDQYEEVE